MSQENVEIVRRSLDGWNRGDFDAWGAGAHPEIEWRSAISGQFQGPETVSRGLEEMRRFWDDWHSVWDLTVEVAEARDLGDVVLVLGHMRMRGEGSGIEVDSPVAYVFEFEGGLARKARAFIDPQQALEAVGLSE
jgi:ketosteroid isomerase-like protein